MNRVSAQHSIYHDSLAARPVILEKRMWGFIGRFDDVHTHRATTYTCRLSVYPDTDTRIRIRIRILMMLYTYTRIYIYTGTYVRTCVYIYMRLARTGGATRGGERVR